MLGRTFFWRGLAAAAFTVLLAAAPSAKPAVLAPNVEAAHTSELSGRLAALEQAIEQKRRELAVPGVALVIVKDDKVVFLKGLGLRDVAKDVAVGPDTLFPIGSATKAFTAMAALISADAGLLSLDDSPRKFLPYFKLADPEADAKIALRDLLDHSSGLARTDLSWLNTPLTREEAIRLMARAKPTAKLRQAFQYQNNMYSAAGEIVGRANGSTWEQVIAERLFKPLGMASSVASMAPLRSAADVSTGHALAGKQAAAVPLVDIDNAAPAGGIASTARDMAQWLRLMLAAGEFEGQRLVSEGAFQEMTKLHMAFGSGGYGLGWFIESRNGQKVLHHAGNVPGFKSLVYLIPDQKLGFVLLTNVFSSPLPAATIEAVWNNLVDLPAAAPVPVPAAPSDEEVRREVGRYITAGFTMEIQHKDGKLITVIAGQPEYALVPLGGRRYKLGAPAPAGFFVTLRGKQGDEGTTELFLEQPQGNLLLVKETDYAGPYRELIGSYEFDGRPIEVVGAGGKLGLLLPGQPMYTLVEKATDELALVPLPDTFRMLVTRDAQGTVRGFVLRQPNGTFTVTRKSVAPSALPSAEDIMEKRIAAHGGEAALRKPRTMVVTGEAQLENQGLTGEMTVREHPTRLNTAEVVFKAFGKRIGAITIRFDGKTAVTDSSFGDGKPADSDGGDFDLYGLANWKSLFSSVTVTGIAKVGNEETYVIVKLKANGHRTVDYVSSKSFLLLKRETTSKGVTTTEFLGDYREFGGVLVAMRTLSLHPVLGRVVTLVREVTFEDDVVPVKFSRAG